MVELQKHPVFLGIGLDVPYIIMKGYQITNDQEMFNAAKRNTDQKHQIITPKINNNINESN